MTYKTKNWKRKNNKDKKNTLYKTTCCKLQSDKVSYILLTTQGRI